MFWHPDAVLDVPSVDSVFHHVSHSRNVANWKRSSLKVFSHWRAILRATTSHSMVLDHMLTSQKVCHWRRKKNFVQTEISSKNQIQLFFFLVVWDAIGQMLVVFSTTTMPICSSGLTKRTKWELSLWKRVMILNVLSLGSLMPLPKSKKSSRKTVRNLKFSLNLDSPKISIHRKPRFTARYFSEIYFFN